MHVVQLLNLEIFTPTRVSFGPVNTVELLCGCMISEPFEQLVPIVKWFHRKHWQSQFGAVKVK